MHKTENKSTIICEYDSHQYHGDKTEQKEKCTTYCPGSVPICADDWCYAGLMLKC